jgi:hypothetical protein
MVVVVVWRTLAGVARAVEDSTVFFKGRTRLGRDSWIQSVTPPNVLKNGSTQGDTTSSAKLIGLGRFYAPEVRIPDCGGKLFLLLCFQACKSSPSGPRQLTSSDREYTNARTSQTSLLTWRIMVYKNCIEGYSKAMMCGPR